MKTNAEEFIKNHHHINYCEAIIYPDGNIEYAKPSHVEHLIRISGKSRDQIYEEMPADASPIYWMVDYTRCIAVYTKGYILPELIKRPQLRTLMLLLEHKLVENNNLW